MRWPIFIIVGYLAIVMQTSLGALLTFRLATFGSMGPDFPAMLVVVLAVHSRTRLEAVLAAAVLGLAMDLTTSGGMGGASVVGPMVLAYAMGAGMVYGVRDVFYKDRWPVLMFLTLLFCLVSHGAWITMQGLRAYSTMTWGIYGRMWLQAVALATFTAILMPLLRPVLTVVVSVMLGAPVRGKHRRRHMRGTG